MPTFPRFSVVTVQSQTNLRPAVKLWVPNTPEQPALQPTTWRAVGVTMTASDYPQPVAVMRRGIMRNVAPREGETWNVLDSLWAVTGGIVSNVRPAAPDAQLFIGEIFGGGDSDTWNVSVDVRLIPSLGELSGVRIDDPPEDLDVFIYKSADQVWEPRQLEVRDARDGRRYAAMMGGW